MLTNLWDMHGFFLNYSKIISRLLKLNIVFTTQNRDNNDVNIDNHNNNKIY